jgi:hypothetical protein
MPRRSCGAVGDLQQQRGIDDPLKKRLEDSHTVKVVC